MLSLALFSTLLLSAAANVQPSEYTYVGNSYCREFDAHGESMIVDYLHWSDYVDSLASCKAKCESFGSAICRAYDFNTSDKCQIYTSTPLTVKASQPGRAVCYSACSSIQTDVDYPGNDLNAGGLMGRVPGHLTLAECHEWCRNDARCVGYTFVKSETTRDNCAVKQSWKEASRSEDRSCCDSRQMISSCRAENFVASSKCSLNGFWNPENYDYVQTVTEGVVSDFPSHGPGSGVVSGTGTVHWRWHNNNREHRGTFSDDCSTVTWENNKRWFRVTQPAFWEYCRWQDASPHEKSGAVTYMGYACADDEILVGFELSSEGIVDKIKCCSVGGHSSLTDVCSIDKSQAHQASCDANKHMVFNGVYDKQDPDAQEDAFLEVLAGRCCEVKCHAKWCGANDWGVSDECKNIGFGQNEGSQDLECPSGYLMTAVHEDANSRLAKVHGVQRINEITCCKLDLVAAPTQAPSVSPSLSPSPSPTTAPTPAPTTKPSPSPTTAPSPSPTTSPTTAPTSVGECLLALRDANLTNKQFLEGIKDCVPCFLHNQRRNLAGRLLSESQKY